MDKTIDDLEVEDVPLEAEEVRFSQAATKVTMYNDWVNVGGWSLLALWVVLSGVWGIGFAVFMPVLIAMAFILSVIETKLLEKRIAKVYRAFYQKVNAE